MAAIDSSFQHALAGEIEVDVVLEDDIHHREAELGSRANRLHAGQPLQIDRQRIRDLILDFLRAAPRPVGKHDHLVLRKIGDRVDRRVNRGVNTPHGECQRQHNHHERVSHGIVNNLLNHTAAQFVSLSPSNGLHDDS